MQCKQNIVKLVCLLCVLSLVIINAFWNLVSFNIVHNVDILTELHRHRETNTDALNCSNITSQHGLHSPVTPTSLSDIFGCCINVTDVSSDSFNAVFRSQVFKNVVCQPRKIDFLKVRKSKIVLASFPGSGNTWMRHLLEQLTGVWTGSVYNDARLRRVFLGENLCPNSNKTFIVKSHQRTSMLNDRKRYCIKTGIEDNGESVRHFDGAILLLRNPYDAILAEFNRRHGGHTGKPQRTYLLEYTEGWHKFVFAKSERWNAQAKYWLTQYDGPIHVVFYENLKISPAYELYRLSEFLHTAVSYQTLWCTMERGRGEFHREKPEWMTRSTLYTPDMLRAVDTQIADVETTLANRNVSYVSYKEIKDT